MSSLSSQEIAALSIGLTINSFIILSFIGFTILYKNKTNMFTDEKIFFVKKWFYIMFILLLNAGMCCVAYYTSNLQILLYIILVLKSKDILMSIMFTFNCIYKFIKKCIKSDNSEDEGENEDVKIAISKTVAFVPTYKETINQVTRTIDSLIANKVGLICIVSDGINDYKDIITNISKEVSDKYYKSWKGHIISTNIYYGTRNNANIMLIHKNENVGKKDSIILTNHLFNSNKLQYNDINSNFITFVTLDLSEIFNVSKFEYMIVSDSDTIVDKNACSSLINNIQKRNAIACCGIVNVDFSSGNYFWNKLQNFQYLYGQYLRRTNEDIFNQVLCLPGCISMFKLNKEILDAVDVFSNIPNNNEFVTSCVQYIGTDRRFTSSLIYTNSNAKIILDTNCHAYTLPPSNFSSYLSQRRRWCQNMYFNSLTNVSGPNVNFILRFFNFIDWIRLSLIYFRLFNTCYFVYLLITTYQSYKLIDIVPYIVILSYQPLCFLIYSLFNSHLRPQWVSFLITILFNKIFTLFSTIIIFTNMLWHIGNESWNARDQNIL